MFRLSRAVVIRLCARYTKEYTGRDAPPYSGRNYKNVIPKNNVMRLQLMLHTVCKSKYYFNYVSLVLFFVLLYLMMIY